jgi:hypothetical protein
VHHRGVWHGCTAPLLDTSNETSGPPGIIEIDGVHSYAAAPTVGTSIADQLVAAHKTWKTYQESLPLSGADGIQTFDGFFTDTTVFTALEQSLGETTGAINNLYRQEHNPFVYFANVQASVVNGQIPGVASWQGPTGLMAVGDLTLKAVVTAIKASPAWTDERSAIVIVWDESDYSASPITNQVVAIVDKNYGRQRVKSSTFYTHFSLLNTAEAALGLPCLNHACDGSTNVMSDLFSE